MTQQYEFIQHNYIVCDANLYHKAQRVGIAKRYMDKPIGSPVGQGKRYLAAKINGMNILIHRAIYMCIHGPIPEGYQIHHIDGNRNNNDINNLECLHPDEHKQRH